MKSLFDVKGKKIVITGGAGVLGSTLAMSLSKLGALIAIMDLNESKAHEIAETMKGKAKGFKGDVLDKHSVENAFQEVVDYFGAPDILINGAGGNHPKATTSNTLSFFDLPVDKLRFVNELNLLGTIIPSQVVGRMFAERSEGIILNISSMNAFRPLTRIPAYSAAKAAVSNFTQWLAVHMAQIYSPKIRVNAIAPGFFLTEQNRFLLTDEQTGKLTERGKKILDHTPMNRFGAPEDLVGAVQWLISDASQFVTGIVVPVDGGFSAYSGV
ncbi:MAG: SDR family oxidoreductase [Candidatus Marinimicrobia bacterium]|nr:SDR family oxidoreductase [Candidatus Neomarinimicrobiota bacterium]